MLDRSFVSRVGSWRHLAVTNQDSNTLSVLLSNGDGSFQAQQIYATGDVPCTVAAADIDGDGKTALAVANRGSDTVSVLLGHGDGTFQPQRTFAAGKQPQAVAVADVNGDRRLDLIVANYGDWTVSVLLQAEKRSAQP